MKATEALEKIYSEKQYGIPVEMHIVSEDKTGTIIEFKIKNADGILCPATETLVEESNGEWSLLDGSDTFDVTPAGW